MSYTVDDVHINQGNFLSRQICVPKAMSTEDATRLLNQKDECGTANGWVFAPDLGEVDCAADPNKKHMVFRC